MNTHISIFKDTFSKDSPVDVPLDKVLDGIKNGRWAELVKSTMKNKENKKLLPCTTFSGTFSTRTAKGLKVYSSIMTVDIDSVDNIANLKKSLMEDPYTYCFFVSPSRNGLKVLIKVSGGEEMHQDNFKSIEQYFLSNHGVCIDKSGKDVCRLCYVSYDSELHLNESSEVYKYIPIEKPEKGMGDKYNFKPISSREQEICTDTNHLYDVAVKFNNRKFVYVEGSRNVYIHALACVLNKFGIPMGEATTIISQNCPSPPIGIEELNLAVASAYRNSSEFGVTKVYWDKPKEIIEEKKPVEKTKNNKEEEKLQFGICRHLKENYPGTVFYSESSGLKASIGVAMKLKAQRSESGLPDLTIMKANGGYFGLAIEIKCESNSPYKKDGVTLRDNSHIREQKEVLDKLREEGYMAVFATGWIEIKSVVDEYMKLPPTNKKNN